MLESMYAIVLAAGTSSRFGSTKQLAEFNDASLVERACQLAANVLAERTLLVTGHDAVRVHQAAGRFCRATVINEGFSQGLGTSVAAGIRALPDTASGALVILADQPLISTTILQTLCAEFARSDDTVASRYGDALGPPAVFPRRRFEELRSLTGDQGAKALLTEDSTHVIDIGASGEDVDHPADLERLSQPV